VSASAGAAVVLEWRDAGNEKARWSQVIMVPRAETITLVIEEPHDFEDGDRLRLGILGASVGMVQGTLSLK